MPSNLIGQICPLFVVPKLCLLDTLLGVHFSVEATVHFARLAAINFMVLAVRVFILRGRQRGFHVHVLFVPIREQVLRRTHVPVRDAVSVFLKVFQII